MSLLLLFDPTFKHVSGFIRNADGTVFTGGATVELIDDITKCTITTVTSSTADGSYVFTLGGRDPNTYHVAAFYAGTNPQQGVTQKGLASL